MDPEQLQLFLHLSRTLHYGRTSRACHVSPSALTRAIQRLEARVGSQLLDRSPRSVRLTPAGKRFAAYAREALERWDTLRRELEGAAPLRGTLSIFCTATASHSILPHILPAFRRAHPEVTLRIETGYAANALERLEEFDLTVAALPPRLPRDLEAHIVASTPLRLIGPTQPCQVEAQLRASPTPWERVPVLMPYHGLARQALMRWFRRRRKRPNVYTEVRGSEATLTLSALGCGIGVVPELVLERSPLREQVRTIEPAALGTFNVGLCTTRDRLQEPTVEAFWACVNQ